jgi:hypothetical protein
MLIAYLAISALLTIIWIAIGLAHHRNQPRPLVGKAICGARFASWGRGVAQHIQINTQNRGYDNAR